MAKKTTKPMSLHDMAVRLCEGGIVECSGHFLRAIDVVNELHPCYLCSMDSACNQEICDLCFECDEITGSGHVLSFAYKKRPIRADSGDLLTTNNNESN